MAYKVEHKHYKALEYLVDEKHINANLSTLIQVTKSYKLPRYELYKVMGFLGLEWNHTTQEWMYNRIIQRFLNDDREWPTVLKVPNKYRKKFDCAVPLIATILYTDESAIPTVKRKLLREQMAFRVLGTLGLIWRPPIEKWTYRKPIQSFFELAHQVCSEAKSGEISEE